MANLWVDAEGVLWHEFYMQDPERWDPIKREWSPDDEVA